jgi:hypothetical protein
LEIAVIESVIRYVPEFLIVQPNTNYFQDNFFTYFSNWADIFIAIFYMYALASFSNSFWTSVKFFGILITFFSILKFAAILTHVLNPGDHSLKMNAFDIIYVVRCLLECAYAAPMPMFACGLRDDDYDRQQTALFDARIPPNKDVLENLNNEYRGANLVIMEKLKDLRYFISATETFVTQNAKLPETLQKPLPFALSTPDIQNDINSADAYFLQRNISTPEAINNIWLQTSNTLIHLYDLYTAVVEREHNINRSNYAYSYRINNHTFYAHNDYAYQSAVIDAVSSINKIVDLLDKQQEELSRKTNEAKLLLQNITILHDQYIPALRDLENLIAEQIKVIPLFQIS